MAFGMSGHGRVRVRFVSAAVAFASALVLVSASPASPAGALSSTKLPPGFPKQVPLPRGALLPGTARDGNAFEVDIAVKGSVPVVIRAYMAQLRKAGFEFSSSHVGGSQNYFFASGRKWNVDATVETGAKGTSARSLPGDSIVELDVYKP